MKITKLSQSCLIVEQAGFRIVIDPGSFIAKDYYSRDLLPLNGILITHEHADHADPELIRALAQQAPDMPVVGNESTAGAYEGLITKVVKDGEKFTIKEFNIQARELPHCRMMDGTEGPQNTGYVIDEIFFHPGDGVSIEGLNVKAAAVPIAGPDISPRDVADFIREINCKTVIPIHYDYFTADPHFFAQTLSQADKSLKVEPLGVGESTDII